MWTAGAVAAGNCASGGISSRLVVTICLSAGGLSWHLGKT